MTSKGIWTFGKVFFETSCLNFLFIQFVCSIIAEPYYKREEYRKRVEKELQEFCSLTLPDGYSAEKKKVTKLRKATDAGLLVSRTFLHCISLVLSLFSDSFCNF